MSDPSRSDHYSDTCYHAAGAWGGACGRQHPYPQGAADAPGLLQRQGAVQEHQPRRGGGLRGSRAGRHPVRRGQREGAGPPAAGRHPPLPGPNSKKWWMYFKTVSLALLGTISSSEHMDDQNLNAYCNMNVESLINNLMQKFCKGLKNYRVEPQPKRIPMWKGEQLLPTHAFLIADFEQESTISHHSWLDGSGNFLCILHLL